MDIKLIGKFNDLAHKLLSPFSTIAWAKHDPSGYIYCEVTFKFKTDEQLSNAIAKLEKITD